MPTKKYDEWITVLENKKVNPKYFKLVFQSKGLSQGVLPGQFVQMQIRPASDLFLRRPFSYYRVTGARIEILYEVLGRGTALLSEVNPGEVLKVMGPFGKPFAPKVKNKKRILIAGGVGVPPLIFLAEKYPADYLLIGTKSRAEVLPPKELKRVKAKVLHSTNDGSYGVKGYVTVLLEEIIKKEGAKNLFIQTCGPKPMMHAVMKLANQRGIEGEASLDETMGCGVGACLGCVVKTKEGYVASCVEGPVFSFRDLALEA